MNIDLFVQNVKKQCAKKGIKPTVALEESGAGRNLLGQLKNREASPPLNASSS